MLGERIGPRPVWNPRCVQRRRLTIVGAAIRDEQGRILAAQRAEPPAVAGWWEFPGGKVEPGESDRAALIRECQEELGVTVSVGPRIGEDIVLPAGDAVLRVWFATIVAGTLHNHEHSALRWLSVAELGDVPWLPADAPIIAAIVRAASAEHAEEMPSS